jgi:hypothetical protein
VGRQQLPRSRSAVHPARSFSFADQPRHSAITGRFYAAGLRNLLPAPPELQSSRGMRLPIPRAGPMHRGAGSTRGLTPFLAEYAGEHPHHSPFWPDRMSKAPPA